MKYIELVEKYILFLSLFLLPVLVLPIFENVYDTPKLLVLIFGAIILLGIKIVKSVYRKSLEFNSSRFDLPVLIFMIIFFLSGILIPFNRIDAFVFPGVASFAILAGLYYFLINQLPKEDKDNIIYVMLGSGFVIALLQITAFVGLNKMIPWLPEFMKPAIFTPFGNILSSIVFLASLIPFLVEKIMNRKEITQKILSGLVGLVFMVSIASSLYLILPGKDTSISILDYKTSWSIAIDSLKTNPLLGVGPGNYSEAFLKYKPVEFNMGDSWNLRYIQGSSSLMTIFTEIGILGIIITLFIFGYALKTKELKQPLYVSILILFLVLLFLPISSSFYPVVFLMLALNSDAKDGKLAFFIKRYAIIFLAIPIILTLVYLGYFFGKAFYGEFLFTKAVKQINLNQGQSAYELANKAIVVNQYSDRYHLLAAGINLAIAQNIAKQESLTDTDKSNISQLIQQSIAEGKAATSVNPRKSSNWETLSAIYQEIIAFAEGADQFAIQSLNQAIFLEPTNPFLRIKLGGIFYAQNKFEDAIKIFELAVLAKPDFANSHYNLAMAYKGNKQLDKAKEQMEIVLKLVEPNSKDYELVTKELETLTTKTEQVEKIEPIQTENLTPPQGSPEPVIDPQLELPAEEVPQQ